MYNKKLKLINSIVHCFFYLEDSGFRIKGKKDKYRGFSIYADDQKDEVGFFINLNDGPPDKRRRKWWRDMVVYKEIGLIWVDKNFKHHVTEDEYNKIHIFV